MQTTFSIILSTIQSKLDKIKNNPANEDNNNKAFEKTWYLIYLTIPEHKASIKKYLEEVAKKQKEEEFLRARYKGKYSIFPVRLIRHERRMFGSGVFEERWNQSISHPKKSGFWQEKVNNKKEEEKKEEVKVEKYFRGRRNEKSRTIHDTSDLKKELGKK